MFVILQCTKAEMSICIFSDSTTYMMTNLLAVTERRTRSSDPIHSVSRRRCIDQEDRSRSLNRGRWPTHCPCGTPQASKAIPAYGSRLTRNRPGASRIPETGRANHAILRKYLGPRFHEQTLRLDRRPRHRRRIDPRDSQHQRPHVRSIARTNSD